MMEETKLIIIVEFITCIILAVWAINAPTSETEYYALPVATTYPTPYPTAEPEETFLPIVYELTEPMSVDELAGGDIVKKVDTVKKVKKHKKKKAKKKAVTETYKVTAYCPCSKCSGGYGGKTATGTIATAGRTIAVDPTVIPYGMHVKINGHEYVAEDCGGAVKGKHIDLFFDNHQTALDWGVRYCEIEILKGDK